MLKAAFGFGDSVTKLVLQKDTEKNSVAVQAGKIASIEQAAKDKIATSLAKGDLKEIRNADAE